MTWNAKKMFLQTRRGQEPEVKILRGIKVGEEANVQRQRERERERERDGKIEANTP